MNQTVTSPAHPRTDFSDRFSPMLVKELRQGLRTRVFTAAFIVIQVVMVLVSLLGTIAASEGTRMEHFTGVFWTTLSILLLVVMPLRGFSALSNEIRDGTMEPVLLTHLSSWRITYGKWLALFSQTVLICLALMPYIVLRYFLGRTDLLSELFWFSMLLLTSGLLTAITVGVSSQKHVLLRLLLIAIPIVMAFMLISGVLFARAFGGGGIPLFLSADPWVFILLTMWSIAFACYYALDMGATYIAPEAENHSTRKRLIGISVVLLNYLWAWLTDIDFEYIMSINIMILIVLSVDALTERITLVPSVYAPFFRRGRMGKIAALFLGPGWAHGSFFLLVCIGLAGLGLIFDLDSIDFEEAAAALMFISMLILPVALIRLFYRNNHSLTLYLVIQISIIVLSGILLTLGSVQGGFEIIASPLPPVALAIIIDGDSIVTSVIACIMLISVTCLSFAIAIRSGRLHMAEASRVYTAYERSEDIANAGTNDQEILAGNHS